MLKDAGSVADDDIEFTDADVEALWKSQKQNYALDEETREPWSCRRLQVLRCCQGWFRRLPAASIY